MQTAQEFMQSYLEEKVELNRTQLQHSKMFHEKFFAKDYLRYFSDWCASKENNPETYVSAENSNDSAKVITIERSGKTQQRYRYHLHMSGTNWEIHRKEWECFACEGTGQKGNKVCRLCNGVGWQDKRGTSP